MSSKDWVEDFNEVGGKHSNQCASCKDEFIGRASRSNCKSCNLGWKMLASEKRKAESQIKLHKQAN